MKLPDTELEGDDSSTEEILFTIVERKDEIPF